MRSGERATHGTLLQPRDSPLPKEIGESIVPVLVKLVDIIKRLSYHHCMKNATGFFNPTAAASARASLPGVAWAVASSGSFLSWRAPRPQRVLYVDGKLAVLRERLALVSWRP